MSGTRLTVRLDARRTALLGRLCAQGNCTSSATVRQALDRLAATATEGVHSTGWAIQNIPSSASAPMPAMANPAVVTPPNSRPAEGVKRQQMRSTDGIFAPDYPKQIVELFPQYRHFGLGIPRERRTLYQRLLAASEIMRQPSDNHRDEDLCRELLRLGKEYGLLQ